MGDLADPVRRLDRIDAGYENLIEGLDHFVADRIRRKIFIDLIGDCDGHATDVGSVREVPSEFVGNENHFQSPILDTAAILEFGFSEGEHVWQ